MRLINTLKMWFLKPVKAVLKMNAAVTGENLRLALDVSGGTTWSTLGKEQNTNISFSTDKADITNKDSTNWEEALGTIRHAVITSSGVLDETDTAFGKILTAYFTAGGPAQLAAKITTPGSTTFIGEVIIDSFEYDGPNDGAMTYSLSLSVTGALAKA